MQGHQDPHAKSVFLLVANDPTKPLGTCFPFGIPGTFLTARHVVEKTPKQAIRIVSDNDVWSVDDVDAHPGVDLAVIKSNDGRMVDPFQIGHPLGNGEFPLGEPVISFGFTIRKDNDDPQPYAEPPRVLRGHIQQHKPVVFDQAEYMHYELPFPAFAGNSGSPVLRDANWGEAIGVVTNGLRFSTRIDDITTIAWWTMAASLHSTRDWLDERLKEHASDRRRPLLLRSA